MIYGLSNRGNSDDFELPARSFHTATLSNVIVRTAVQQLTRFELAQRVARSLCGSGALCLTQNVYMLATHCS